VVACRWVILACQRHLDDLDTGHERGLWWDADEVEDWRLYFLGLRHSKGEWAKPTPQRIVLESWQLFVLGVLWGWKKLDGSRRFREAYIEVPRKQTKSTMAAGVGLRLGFDDDEPGAEVYAVATKLKQARVVWDEAKRMVRHALRLRERIVSLALSLSDSATSQKFEPLGADSEKIDGLNVHGATVDEFHAHKTPAMWTVIDTATGARRQPLLFAITTAGFNRASVCYDRRTYVTKLLQRVIEDDSVFGIIYTIDDEDDWRDPACHAKANPMMGITVKPDDVAAHCKRAIEMPSERTAFLTKRLNVWVNADQAFFEMEGPRGWLAAAKPFDLVSVAGIPCWLGIDLASKSDLAAVTAVFVGEGKVRIRTKFYLPRALVLDGAHAETAHYAGWAASKHLTLTEGNLIDFAVIREDIKALASQVDIREIGYDPYQATQIVTELSDAGLTLVEIPQTVKSLSGPMKAIRDLLRDGKLEHDGNPVMAWCISNVVAHEDANENVFPRKASRNLKIDGATALFTGYARPAVQPATTSVYETRGVLIL